VLILRGDKVWLLRRNIHTKWPSEKLDYQKLAYLLSVKKINTVSYCLTLPPAFKIYNTFHISLLEPYMVNTFPGRAIELLLLMVVDKEYEYDVNEILDTKLI
ncbi:18492_t:CDS:1, partial [Dentiscutata erythropus]